MKPLKALIKRLCGMLKGSCGYTLTEMAAVVATTGVITAVALPVAIEQVNQGKFARAQEDILHLSGAMINLLKTAGDLPMRRWADTAGADVENTFFFTVILSTRRNDVVAGLTPPPLPEIVPPEDNVNGDFFGGVNSGRIASYEAPFFTNRAADVLGGIGDVNGNLYNPNLWRGPYFSRRGLDPWGRSYVIFLQGIREVAFDPTFDTPFKMWILSAGPNGKLETIPTEDHVRGDDMGIVAPSRL